MSKSNSKEKENNATKTVVPKETAKESKTPEPTAAKEIKTPLTSPVKPVVVVKPTIQRVPKVVEKLEKSDESVVSASIPTSSTKVSFARKATGDNTSGIVPEDLSSRVSGFEAFWLRHGVKTRSEGEAIAKRMLGETAVMNTGKNPTEVFFEYEGVRSPSSGMFFIR